MDSELTKTLAAAFAALAVGVVAGWVALRNNRKNLFVGAVTHERAQWRRDLRTATAELVTLAQAALDNPQESLADLHERRVGIRLRVNPAGGPRHPLDQAIMDRLAELPGLLRPSSGPAERDKVEACLEVLETSVQQLLKQEWDKSKAEAQTGRLDR